MVSRRRAEKQFELEEKRGRLPQEGEPLPRVELRVDRRSRHPWIFRRMVRGPAAGLEPGQLVEVVARDGRFAGRGFYNPHSEIALRILADDPAVFPGRPWFRARVAEAVRLREALRLPERTDAYRVVHAEGDGLSGLVVDRFADVLVAELFSAGMHRHWPWVREALDVAFPGLEVVLRADHRVEKQEGVRMDGPAPSSNAARRLVIREGPAKFEVDLRRGHKTGFFLDQRENRARMAELCRGEDLFDGFCYTGGFAIHAALAGAASVLAVDLDEDAVEVALKNRQLNGLGGSVAFHHGNVFDVLRGFKQSGRRFSRMVLDPPKMALAKAEIGKALAAYQDMNRLGMQCLKPGGVLLSCSCSGLVGEAEFLEALRHAASESRADLQIFHVAGAAPDHPWTARFPEGRYLKAVFSRVVPRA